MPDPIHKISPLAHQLGFVLIGVARLEPLEDRRAFYTGWLAAGNHGEMAYLGRDPERRFDPRRLDPRLRAVVSLAYPYQAPSGAPLDWKLELRGRIAAYAAGDDYHERVLGAARQVAEAMQRLRPGALCRTYVDTGPVFEREWAAAAGLGWFGRNTMMLNARAGSYFFLAEIFTDIDFGAAAVPYRPHCGKCRRCIEQCPTGALGDGNGMDARLCISYLTIEHRGPIAPEMRAKLGNWIFGCDICQEVCPFNATGADAGYGAPGERLWPRLAEIMTLDDEGFRRRFAHNAVKRAKRRGLLRNAAVALGNSGNPEAVGILTRTLRQEPEALVRAHAAWALGALGDAQARGALCHALGSEPDPEVRREIIMALDGAYVRSCAAEAPQRNS